MASSKVFVGGLPWTCCAEDLKQVCSKFGFVTDAFIVMDRKSVTPRSKGYGFVTFSNANDAAACLRSLNGSEYGGRVLKVGMAHRESSGAQDYRYGDHQVYAPLGNDHPGIRGGNLSSHNSGFVSGNMYEQQNYNEGYGSNVLCNNMYDYGSSGGNYGAVSSNYNYGQARSSYNINTGSYVGGSQYGGYNSYGNTNFGHYSDGSGNY